MTTTDTTSDTMIHDVKAFIYAEAELLDNRAFPDWLALFTEDCRYWIPGGAETLDPSRKVSLVHDNYGTLAERIWRFEGGLAYAQQPPSVTSHLISSIVVREVETGQHAEGDVVTVSSRFVVSEFRKEQLVHHAGRYEHSLVRLPDGSFKIWRKYVDLVNRTGYLGNLGLPL